MFDLLRRNRDFRLLFAAQLVSYMGDWFATVALYGLVLELSDSDLAASLVFVATTLPQFLMTPLAGPAADRFDRRRLMVLVSAGQAGVAVSLLAVGPGRLWLAFAAQGSVSALAAFFGPAAQASVPNLVDPGDLPTATATMASVWGSMLAVGAGLGGLFAVAFGRDAAFVADAVSFLIAGAVIALIRRRTNQAREEHHARMRPIADTVEALRYARTNKPVLALLLSKMGFGLSGAVVSLFPVLAVETFHGGDASIGALMAARGVGAVAGPLLARRFSKSTPTILFVCGASALLFGVSYLTVPLAPAVAVAVIPVCISHLGGGAQWTLSTYGLQVETPDRFRGRIFAADFALVTLTLSISSLAAGTLSQRFGPSAVIYGLALVSLAWGATYLLVTRGIRRDGRAAAPAEESYAVGNR